MFWIVFFFVDCLCGLCLYVWFGVFSSLWTVCPFLLVPRVRYVGFGAISPFVDRNCDFLCALFMMCVLCRLHFCVLYVCFC